MDRAIGLFAPVTYPAMLLAADALAIVKGAANKMAVSETEVRLARIAYTCYGRKVEAIGANPEYNLKLICNAHRSNRSIRKHILVAAGWSVSGGKVAVDLGELSRKRRGMMIKHHAARSAHLPLQGCSHLWSRVSPLL
jgi:hypothetical protein